MFDLVGVVVDAGCLVIYCFTGSIGVWICVLVICFVGLFWVALWLSLFGFDLMSCWFVVVICVGGFTWCSVGMLVCVWLLVLMIWVCFGFSWVTWVFVFC